MEETLPCFKTLTKEILSRPVHCTLGRLEVHANPQEWDAPVFGQWNERLTSFQKLIMVKCFREEKVFFLSGSVQLLLCTTKLKRLEVWQVNLFTS